MEHNEEHGTNGWSRYENLILFRLNAQDKKMDNLESKLDSIKDALSNVKLKLAVQSATVSAIVVGLWKLIAG